MTDATDVEAARLRSQHARNQMMLSWHDVRDRVKPGAIAQNAAEKATDSTKRFVRRQPAVAAALLGCAALLLVRRRMKRRAARRRAGKDATRQIRKS